MYYHNKESEMRNSALVFTSAVNLVLCLVIRVASSWLGSIWEFWRWSLQWMGFGKGWDFSGV